MLIYFWKKILTVAYSLVKNFMFQFGHGDNVRFGEVQVNVHFFMCEVFVHCFCKCVQYFFAKIRIFLNKKKICDFHVK